jgi:putative membrane-bound dehydrogenase-like protein
MALKTFCRIPRRRLAVALGIAAATSAAWAANYDFPIYTNKPSGKQLSGQHAPAGTPALGPEEARLKFTLPDGFQMRLFASEPMVVNPVAMTWDDRGRLWVLELYEYPLGAKPGQKGRDRIKILEDTDNDGVADKVSVFAEGFNLATGLLLGNGGVYVGQAPHLLFLEDTNGDGKADKQTVLLTGFGLEDRHELLNGFTWGPDGWLYFTHGVFTHSEVRDPANPGASRVVMNGAVARYHPRTHRYEVFADGTSNPWGVDFDATGQAFVSACVIDHFFHLVPGGLYSRQAGQPAYPYAYELLPSIVDHKHHMAAYAGVQIYQGDQYPAEYRGAAIMGNIHDNSLHWDKLTPVGSSYKAAFVRDFLRANDGWFMPVSTQTGPDGALWVMDWYDKYPCYQNANADPEGVDRERGRIWRIVHTGADASKRVPSRPERDMNLEALSSPDLAKVLAHPNSWHRRHAQRILTERGESAFGRSLHGDNPVRDLLKNGKSLDGRLAALWTLHTMGLLDDNLADECSTDPEPAIRAWAARTIGEHGYLLPYSMRTLGRLARDPDPTVRLAVAVACRQLVSSRLTVNEPPLMPLHEAATGGILSDLFLTATPTNNDPVLNFMFWMAVEPLVAYDPVHAISFFPGSPGDGGAGSLQHMPLAGIVLQKALRRVCDLHEEGTLSESVIALGKLDDRGAPLIVAALQGLIEGQRGKALVPSAAAVETIRRFAAFANKEVSSRAQQLGVLWGDATAYKSSLARVADPSVPEADRISGIRALRSQRSNDTREAMFRVLESPGSDPVKVEAIRALGELGGDELALRLLPHWENLSPASRQAAAELMSSREIYISAFLKAAKAGSVKRGDIPPTVVRKLSTHGEPVVRQMAEEVFGKFTASSEEKLKLIAAKRKVVTDGPVDLEAGHEVAKRTCFICHAMYGEGAQVGPDLTGVGRSSLDALLHNVINPNEIIGQGYENVEVETRDGRTITGRMAENNDSRVRMLLAGGQEEVVARSDVKSLRVTQNSVMPEGLEQMPDADFRNLIWFILAHPKDGKPLNEQRRRELINAGGDHASTTAPTDGESVALWNPEWMVSARDFAGTPAKLPEFAGRRNVLVTHPSDARTPAALARALNLPVGRASALHVAVAAAERGSWTLRILVDGELLQQRTITRDATIWQTLDVDLSRFGGRRVVIRLENAGSGHDSEFAYWSDLRIDAADPRQAALP